MQSTLGAAHIQRFLDCDTFGAAIEHHRSSFEVTAVEQAANGGLPASGTRLLDEPSTQMLFIPMSLWQRRGSPDNKPTASTGRAMHAFTTTVHSTCGPIFPCPINKRRSRQTRRVLTPTRKTSGQKKNGVEERSIQDPVMQRYQVKRDSSIEFLGRAHGMKSPGNPKALRSPFADLRSIIKAHLQRIA